MKRNGDRFPYSPLPPTKTQITLTTEPSPRTQTLRRERTKGEDDEGSSGGGDRDGVVSEWVVRG